MHSAKLTERQLEHKSAYCIRPLEEHSTFPLMEFSFSSLWVGRGSFLLHTKNFRNQEPSWVVKVLPKYHYPVIVNIRLPFSTLQILSVIPSPILMEGQGHEKNSDNLRDFAKKSAQSYILSLDITSIREGSTSYFISVMLVPMRKTKCRVRPELLEM